MIGQFVQSVLANTAWWHTIVMFVIVAVALVVAVYFIKVCNATSECGQMQTNALEELDRHNTSILVCLRTTAEDDGPAVARFMVGALRTAQSPLRVNFGLVQVGTTEDALQRYISLTGESSTDYRKNIRIANLLPEEHGGNAGSFATAWKLWRTRLFDDDAVVMVVDFHRFKPKAGWDVALEVLVERSLPTGGVFTASAPTAFPSIRRGAVEDDFFPAVAPCKFANPHQTVVVPSVVVDPGLLVIPKTSAVFSTELPHCPDTMVGAVLASSLHDRGIKMWTGACGMWVDPSHESTAANSWRPSAKANKDNAARPRLTRTYCKFANIDDADKDDGDSNNKNATDSGDTAPPAYVTGVRARMGLTSGHNHTQERFIKWGSMAAFVAARKQETFLHKRMQ
jgi:hypothetical protein